MGDGGAVEGEDLCCLLCGGGDALLISATQTGTTVRSIRELCLGLSFARGVSRCIQLETFAAGDDLEPSVSLDMLPDTDARIPNPNKATMSSYASLKHLPSVLQSPHPRWHSRRRESSKVCAQSRHSRSRLTRVYLELQVQYQNYKNNLQNIAQKIGEVEQEAEEHKFVPSITHLPHFLIIKPPQHYTPTSTS